MLHAAQIRGARAMLRWSRPELSRICGVSVGTLEKIEAIEGIPNVQSDTMRKLLECFTSHGVLFFVDSHGNPGVSINTDKLEAMRN